MKKLLILSFFLLVAMAVSAQAGKKVEVLYFKANLACCKAKSCAMLEADIKAIVEKNFSDGSVVFVEVKLADEANRALVEKYKAGSQTVVAVMKRKKKEKVTDLTEKVKQYVRTQDKAWLENELLTAISNLKKK